MNEPPKKKKANKCEMLIVDTEWLKKTSTIWRLDKVCHDKNELHIIHNKS